MTDNFLHFIVTENVLLFSLRAHLFIILLAMAPFSAIGGPPHLAKTYSLKIFEIMDSSKNMDVNEMEASLTRSRGRTKTSGSSCQGQNVAKLAQDIFGNRKIAHLLSEPRVLLYSRINYAGNVIEYDFASAANEGNCHNLRGFANTKSVYTNGKCVRLFSDGECRGRSMAVYPGSNNSRKVNGGTLTRVSSIGTCLPDEFQFDGERDTFIKGTSDVKGYVPNFIDIFDYQKDNQCENYNNCALGLSSLYCCTQDDLQRVDFLKARIARFSIDPLRPTDSRGVGFPLPQEMDVGDVMGYGIPPRYGGSLEAYNVFAQSQAGQHNWLHVLSEIPVFLNASNSRKVEIALNFQYRNRSTSRPSSFYYHLRYLSDQEPKVFYGRVIN